MLQNFTPLIFRGHLWYGMQFSTTKVQSFSKISPKLWANIIKSIRTTLRGLKNIIPAPLNYEWTRWGTFPVDASI